MVETNMKEIDYYLEELTFLEIKAKEERKRIKREIEDYLGVEVII